MLSGFGLRLTGKGPTGMNKITSTYPNRNLAKITFIHLSFIKIYVCTVAMFSCLQIQKKSTIFRYLRTFKRNTSNILTDDKSSKRRCKDVKSNINQSL